MLVSLVGFAVLLFMIMVRMPIGIAMGLVGFFGFAWLNDWNWNAALSMSARRIIDTSRDYSLTVIPLFILMGNFVTKSGLSNELYRAS
ncbi:MAG TPA: TRAP transporter large permease subunit, partial [Thiolinea sp.]|nr:TRAP transporter large permease subunit [Thiolinea sp.]